MRVRLAVVLGALGLCLAGTPASAAAGTRCAKLWFADSPRTYVSGSFWVYINERTSCTFGIRSARAWAEGVRRTGYWETDFTAYSPVTGRSYRMHCTTTLTVVVTCRGANGAMVRMRPIKLHHDG